ncbi:PDDEXK nuclease domain-containing protein [Raineyella sp. W15-4]|uniref:PDDEXK nuclease domain-containing protein n=1 Tax=Raineyella sp. W15-4 TaxID=3081651 RepID=UPI0029535F2D|nr:PDDEXK nuclease domain-containing protein [Raineyella sp. W15-4]WOQ16367.1 PDDEXK nuclease domain-containing protein [Raineyella sp. W15-4]
MTDLVPRDDIPADEEGLFDYVVEIVEQGRRVAASQVNATLTMTHWLVGRAISIHVLRNERAEYGKMIVATLGRKLTERYGSGYGRSNLNRMVAFFRTFSDHAATIALARQLSWSHIRELIPLKSDEARAFYAEAAAAKHLSVRELNAAIERKAYERREIANSQIPAGSAVPRDTFSDPLILDALGLHDTFLEKDLEAAILRDMQAFLMEVGHGFTFVAEYWTILPPKAELEAKLGEIVRDAQERLARRGIAATITEDDDTG